MRYRLYLDESGNEDIGHLADDRHRFLSLTGVIMDQRYAERVATPRLNLIKKDIFDAEPDEVILHRKDIMNKNGPFGVLSDEELCTKFDEQLLDFITELRFSVITAVIDKRGMVNMKHWRNQHPYHYLIEILAEKYCRLLESIHSTGDIMPEKREGKKDEDLQKAFEEVLYQSSQ
jgi:Protein of unknown function (DUF3800)